MPTRPDPAIQDLTRRHPPELLRTVGRRLVRHGTERDVVSAGLAALAETATERALTTASFADRPRGMTDGMGNRRHETTGDQSSMTTIKVRRHATTRCPSAPLVSLPR